MEIFIQDIWVGPVILYSSKLLGDVNAAGLWTPLQTAVV